VERFAGCAGGRSGWSSSNGGGDASPAAARLKLLRSRSSRGRHRGLERAEPGTRSGEHLGRYASSYSRCLCGSARPSVRRGDLIVVAVAAGRNGSATRALEPRSLSAARKRVAPGGQCERLPQRTRHYGRFLHISSIGTVRGQARTMTGSTDCGKAEGSLNLSTWTQKADKCLDATWPDAERRLPADRSSDTSSPGRVITASSTSARLPLVHDRRWAPSQVARSASERRSRREPWRAPDPDRRAG
jgi:hypothetical protein